jgi:hypothetical protein
VRLQYVECYRGIEKRENKQSMLPQLLNPAKNISKSPFRSMFLGFRSILFSDKQNKKCWFHEQQKKRYKL